MLRDGHVSVDVPVPTPSSADLSQSPTWTPLTKVQSPTIDGGSEVDGSISTPAMGTGPAESGPTNDKPAHHGKLRNKIKNRRRVCILQNKDSTGYQM